MSQDFPSYASVVLDLSLDRPLDYGIPMDQIARISPGVRVEVPLRGKLYPGFVVAIKNQPDFTPAKAVSKILSEEPLISKELMQLAFWMARYYCAPLQDIFKILMPPGVRQSMAAKEQLFVARAKSREELKNQCIALRAKCPSQATILDVLLNVTKGILLTELLEKSQGSRSSVDALARKGLILLETVKIDRSPLVDVEYFQTKPKELNAEQRAALEKIDTTLRTDRFDTHLLFGITGSGKTEVYLQAIEKALHMNKGAIMLVPEISLTAQTIERFKSRFQEKIAILHHRLSQGERNDEWHQIHQGKAKIVIGARSAIFSPVVNLGLIIVDEEHEQSYKQHEGSPCYQARDVAVMRGKIAQAAVILGSATPSLESYYNAQNGKYILSMLHQRANVAKLPRITLVDMKKEFEKKKGFTSFSDILLSGIKTRQERGEQSILFLNRRGYHTTLLCQECQHTIRCNHCDVALTFHFREDQLACHLCGFHLAPPTSCPACKKGKTLKFKGVGTEQIERSLHAILPGIRTLRIDADTTKHKGSHQKLLRDFGTGKADLLIGTQMIAKGLHFPLVTLVGVLNGDAGLTIPDFRASETTFQLITQVSGRSGRGATEGEVIIQTSMPENSTIQHAARQDYPSFYDEEIAIREMFHYPPFTRMAKITFSGAEASAVMQAAESIRTKCIQHLPPECEIMPVVPAGYAKVKDRFRYQFLMKAKVFSGLHAILSAIEKGSCLPRQIKISIDIDPSSTFF